MAVPKSKISKSRRDKRRTHYKLNIPGMSVCPNVVKSNYHTAYANPAEPIKM